MQQPEQKPQTEQSEDSARKVAAPQLSHSGGERHGLTGRRQQFLAGQRGEVARFERADAPHRVGEDRIVPPVRGVVSDGEGNEPDRQQEEVERRSEDWPIGQARDDAVFLDPELVERRHGAAQREHAHERGAHCRHPGGHVEGVRADLEVLAGPADRKAKGAPRRGLGQSGYRTGLQDGGLPIRPGPLDVLRLAKMPLDGVAESSQAAQRAIGQNRLGRGPAGDLLDAAAGSGTHLDLMPPQAPFDDPPAEASFAQDDLVRRDEAADDGLAQSRAGVDDRFVAGAGDRVGGEQHAGALGGDQSLHDNGELHAGVGEAVLLAVADGPVGPERAPTAAHGVEQRVFVDDAEKGILLPGEGGAGQILRGGAGSDGHGARAELAVGRQDRFLDVRGNHGAGEGVANCRAVARLLGTGDQRTDAIRGDDALVRGSGDDEPRRNREAGPVQLTEIRRLAADLRQIGRADVGEACDDR